MEQDGIVTLHGAYKGNRVKPLWVTVEELAGALGLSVKSIRPAYRTGQIPVLRIGRLVRFDVEHVKQVLQRKEQVAKDCFRKNIAAALDGRTDAGRARRRAQPQAPGLSNGGAISN